MSKFSALSRMMLARFGRLWEPSLSREPLPAPDPARARAALVSYYMPNVSHRVVLAQRRVLKVFTPPDVDIIQIETVASPPRNVRQEFMRRTRYRTILFLDIDCIPLNHEAIGKLIGIAEGGVLAGGIQRAVHLKNDEHLYVGTYCMALTPALYREIGEPTFRDSPTNDAGEELTHAMERLGRPIHFLWPTHVEEPIWHLTGTKYFGRGTTVGDDFWHAFQIRERIHQERFIQRCEKVLAKEATKTAMTDA